MWQDNLEFIDREFSDTGRDPRFPEGWWIGGLAIAGMATVIVVIGWWSA